MRWRECVLVVDVRPTRGGVVVVPQKLSLGPHERFFSSSVLDTAFATALYQLGRARTGVPM